MYKCLLIASVLVIFTLRDGKLTKFNFWAGGGEGVLIKNIETLYTLYYLTLGFFQGFFLQNKF